MSATTACQTVAGLEDKSAADGGDAGRGVVPDGSSTVGDTGTPTTCVPLNGDGDAGTLTCAPWDGGSAEAGACAPLTDVGSFAPSWKAPAPLHQNKCTQQEIEDFRNLCLGTGDPSACQSFLAGANGKVCAACILTQPTAPQLGPLVDHTAQGFVDVNTTGCIAALEPCNTTCAMAIQAESQCDDAVCVNCKVTDAPSLTALNACTQWANACACSDYSKKAACADGLKGSDHPASVCLAGSDFTSKYNAIVPLFCGP